MCDASPGRRSKARASPHANAGGSGSSTEDIQYAIEAGTIKMNIDTDTQWSFWDGIREYEAANHDYLQQQIGTISGVRCFARIAPKIGKETTPRLL